MSINLGNVTALLRSQTPPTKTYLIWGKILNPSFPDLVELNYYDPLTTAWTPVTEPTTQHWLRPVLDNATGTPPVTPTEGDRYLVPAGALGLWSGKDDQIAIFKLGNWVFQIPQDGFIVSVRTEANKLFDYRGTYGGGGFWGVNDFQVPIAPGTYVVSTDRGIPLGICDLDSSGKIKVINIDGSTLPYAPTIPGNWPAGLTTIPEALDHLILNIGGGSSSGISLTKNIAKTAHGFIIGNVLTVDGTGAYVKISNTNLDKPIGIVTTVTDANNVKISMAGFIYGLSGLTAGAIFYVQATGYISTTPTAIPYLLALSTTEAYILGGGGGTSSLDNVLAAGNDAGVSLIKNVLDPVDPQDVDTKAAREAAILLAISNLVNTAPGVLDTLSELAAALGNDPNFATTVAGQIALKAPLASPTLTGTPLAPTAAPGTNTTQIATTAFIQAAITVILNSAPGSLDTLGELSAAIGNDPAFATTVATALATKFNKVGDTITGTAGAGYVGIIKQSSNPSTPADGIRLFTDANGKLSYIDEGGKVRTIQSFLTATFDGQGSVILAGSKVYFRVPTSGVITGWSIVAEGTGPTCTIDIWKIATGTALPVVGNTIMGTKPALATGNAIKSTTLTSWTTAFTAEDIFCINIDACSAATKIHFVLYR